MTPKADKPLSDEEKEGLGILARNSALVNRMGVSLKAARSLESRGLIELEVMRNGRTWYSTLTDKGEPVAESLRDFVAPVKVDTKKATSRVYVELCKYKHESGAFAEVWESLSLESLAQFTRDAKAWLGDRSELLGPVIDGADYEELFGDFRTQAGLPPLAEKVSEETDAASVKAWAILDTLKQRQANGKPVMHTRTGKLVGYLKDGKFIPVEDTQGGGDND
jgi:hypothetical protein